MKLYAKQLTSLKALEREKARLRKERKEMEAEGFVSREEVIASITGGAGLSLRGLVQNFAPAIVAGAGPLLGRLGSAIKGQFGKKKKKATAAPATEYEHDHVEEKHGSLMGDVLKKTGNLAGGVGKELLMSYLKWKALELSYKGVSVVVRKRKKKKAERKVAEQAATVNQ